MAAASFFCEVSPWVCRSSWSLPEGRGKRRGVPGETGSFACGETSPGSAECTHVVIAWWEDNDYRHYGGKIYT